VIREVKVVKGRQDLVLSESAQGVSETGAIWGMIDRVTDVDLNFCDVSPCALPKLSGHSSPTIQRVYLGRE